MRSGDRRGASIRGRTIQGATFQPYRSSLILTWVLIHCGEPKLKLRTPIAILLNSSGPRQNRVVIPNIRHVLLVPRLSAGRRAVRRRTARMRNRAGLRRRILRFMLAGAARDLIAKIATAVPEHLHCFSAEPSIGPPPGNALALTNLKHW